MGPGRGILKFCFKLILGAVKIDIFGMIYFKHKIENRAKFNYFIRFLHVAKHIPRSVQWSNKKMQLLELVFV